MDNLDDVLAKTFDFDTAIYNRRGFKRRVGFGEKPALLVIDMANGWTQPGSPFACDGMNSVILAIRDLLDVFREKGLPTSSPPQPMT
ncbi:MAG: maleamate amidohydrolase [Alphaproteobacteria bacterium]|jgi:maleamate amidohydrolase|nr:maleamate amidohydrolase [Alphaproteobacteria bacterium]